MLLKVASIIKRHLSTEAKAGFVSIASLDAFLSNDQGFPPEIQPLPKRGMGKPFRDVQWGGSWQFQMSETKLEHVGCFSATMGDLQG